MFKKQNKKQKYHQPFISVKFLFCFTQEIGPTQHLLQQQQKKKKKKSESKQVGRFKSLNNRRMRKKGSHSFTQHAGREWTSQHTQCCTLCYPRGEPGKKKCTQDGMKTKNWTPLNVQYINYISIYFLIVLPAPVYLTTFHLCQSLIFQSTSVGRLRSWFWSKHRTNFAVVRRKAGGIQFQLHFLLSSSLPLPFLTAEGWLESSLPLPFLTVEGWLESSLPLQFLTADGWF